MSSSGEGGFQGQPSDPPEPPPIVIADSWFEEQAGAGLSTQDGSKHGDSGSAEQRYMDKLVKFYSIYNPGACAFSPPPSGALPSRRFHPLVQRS